MRIGELAERTGKSVATIRYYEKIGLLAEPRRTGSGYRDFDTDAIERIQFIVRAKELSFSLKEIRVVLALHDKGFSPCDRVSKMIQKKIERLDNRITQLQARRISLQKILLLWQNHKLTDAPFCSIISGNTMAQTPESNSGEAPKARTIEVFTAGCLLCKETIEHIKKAVTPCGCKVVICSPESVEAQQYHISSVPAIAIDGQVIYAGTLTEAEATTLLRH
jgi:MerR family copper efflux transcriptional regulator